jgi:hypothetical protein
VTPTARTLAYLQRHRRGLGARVETWVPKEDAPGGGFRRDLFAIADVLWFDDDGTLLMIQCCTEDVAAHRKKILTSPRVERACRLLRQGHRIEIWAWRYRNQRRPGAVKRLALEIIPITLDDALGILGDLPLLSAGRSA